MSVVQVFHFINRRKMDAATFKNLYLHIFNNLKPHQLEAAIDGINRNGRTMLADPPGMGKTRQALAIANHFQREGICLIVTRCSIVDAWKMECRVLGLNSLQFDPNKDYTDFNGYLIINYEKLDQIHKIKVFKKFKKFTSKPSATSATSAKPKPTFPINRIVGLILDESHKIKEADTKACKISTFIAKTAKYVLCISGTPMMSRPVELYTQLNIMKPNFSTFQQFGDEYCGGVAQAEGLADYNGLTNGPKLRKMLYENFIIRRDKGVTDLVKRERELITLDIGGCQFPGESLIDQFNKLPYKKCMAVCNYLEGFFQNEIGKTIVFGHHKIMLDNVANLLKRLNIQYIFIDGSTKKREQLIYNFQTDQNCRVAIMSTIACNMGITLTAATNVIFTELEMNPADIVQAEGRACRIGQTELVKIKFLIVPNSIEEIILKMLGGKEWKNVQLDLVENDEIIKFSKISSFNLPRNLPMLEPPQKPKGNKGNYKFNKFAKFNKFNKFNNN